MLLSEFLQKRLTEHREKYLWRELVNVESPQQVYITYGQQNFLSFASNNYLGLANDPRLITTIKKGVDQYGVGTTSSHLVTGHTKAHHELTEVLAEFLQYPKVLLFSSGYMANLAVISTLIQKKDFVFTDRLNHASLIDACRFSEAKVKRYTHLDMEALQELIKNTVSNNKFIVSDGVFSMDGDLVKLPQLLKIAEENVATIIIDDAHGIGVLGKKGKGCSEIFNQIGKIPILIGTLSKAFGTIGGFVASSEEVIHYLQQFARSHIYTTAMPAALAMTAKTSLQIIQQECWRREYLQDIIQYFRKCASHVGLSVLPSVTPIQPIMIGDAMKALSISQILKNNKILLPAIRPPTIPKNTSRLRVSLTVDHTREHIDELIDKLCDAMRIVEK